MISAISSFSALSPNTKIIASTSDASPVQQVKRVTRKPVKEDIDLQNIGQQNSSKGLLQDRLTLLGDDSVQTGKAYGMEASELRKQGLKNQLSSELNEEVNELDLMGKSSSEVDEEADVSEAEGTEKNPESKKSSSGKELTEDQQKQVKELESRDIEVRTHEQAHLAVAGSLAQGGASFEYQTGPDGKNYAVGGEVSIDTSPEATPEATISKMQQVKAAALAPAEPSSQDRSVAASATQQIAKAMQEKNVSPEENEDQNNNSKIANESSSSSIEDKKEPKTVEEMQEQVVKEAVSGETNEKTAESGLIEIPAELNNVNNTTQNNNNNNKSYIPEAKLSIQQQAARVAYGISA